MKFYTSHIAPHKLFKHYSFVYHKNDGAQCSNTYINHYIAIYKLLNYLALQVILPLVKSYGDNSTFTLSPGRILI